MIFWVCAFAIIEKPQKKAEANMVLRQAALNCAEKVEFVCFILDKISFCFLKKGCPLQEKTALKFIYTSFPHRVKHVNYSVTGTSLMRATVVASPFVILWAPASSTTVVGAPDCFTPSTFTLVFVPERP